MELPPVPQLEQASHITPSTYAAALLCRARGACTASKHQPKLPEHPSSLLGLSFHSVVEKAANGVLTNNTQNILDAAREYFDRKCRELYDSAHPLLHAKFVSPQRMPGYYLFRERAAMTAVEVFNSAPAPSGGNRRPASAATSPASVAERWLKTNDGMLGGRPDFIDGDKSEIVDFKTGLYGESQMSESEARQLRIYAQLALENGYPATTGVIIRPDGRRLNMAVTPAEAQKEAAAAKEVLRSLNSAVAAGETFADLANPAAATCRMCPCVPFCEPFWQTADISWAADAGVQIEGLVTKVEQSTLQGTDLVSLTLDVQRGTAPIGSCTVEQIPASWLLACGSMLPNVGDRVRVTGGRMIDLDSRTVRVDRVATAVWTIAQPSAEEAADG
jgi:hypothetical protein